jgi:predicted Ser/Thr protein kinase
MTTLPKGSSIEIDLVRAALAPDYEVIEELGRGGMAVVYKAREVALDREVAIKVLPSLLAIDEEFVERFTHEARTAGKLEHPNIVPIYRVGQQGQVTYFVMKYLRGQSLSAILRDRTKIPVREVQRILIECASALGYAARFGVVHRDIKPDNVMLDDEGRCVITDFGIAKTRGARLTAPGTSMGTPRYMSPEHAQGVPMDARSDIYSLGVVAYQCLTGMIPFDGEDPFAVLYKHVNNPVPRPALANEEENALYSVIERMLAKGPEERFQNAEALLAALGVTSTSTTLVAPHVPGRTGEMIPTEIINTAPLSILKRIGRMELKGWRLGATAGAAVVAIAGISAWAASRGSAAVADSAIGRVAAATATPVVVPPPLVAKPETLAAAPVVEAPKPPPKPAPYSRCSYGRTSLFLMADGVPAQVRGKSLTVTYDVCGLAEGTPYTLSLAVTRVGQGRFDKLRNGSTPPVIRTTPEVVDGPRTRRKQTIDISELPKGNYVLTIGVTDRNNNTGERRREFPIIDPP